MSAGPAPGAATRRPPRRGFTTAGTVLLVLGVVALAILAWPHKWGGRFGTTVVVGHSMDGTFSTGDLLVTARGQDYRPGDIIVYTVDYEQARGTVVHRIIDERNGVFTTRGDSNTYPDPWQVTPDRIRGRPVLRIPLVGWALLMARTPIVLMLLTGALVTFLLWPSKDEQEDHEEDAEPAEGLEWARSPLWNQPQPDKNAAWPPPQGAWWPFSPPSAPPAPADTPSPPAEPAPTSPD